MLIIHATPKQASCPGWRMFWRISVAILMYWIMWLISGYDMILVNLTSHLINTKCCYQKHEQQTHPLMSADSAIKLRDIPTSHKPHPRRGNTAVTIQCSRDKHTMYCYQKHERQLAHLWKPCADIDIKRQPCTFDIWCLVFNVLIMVGAVMGVACFLTSTLILQAVQQL